MPVEGPTHYKFNSDSREQCDGNVTLDPEQLHKGDAILCRLTKPLVELAFTLIREGIGCHVEGRDIGKQLSNLVNKWKSVTSTTELSTRLVYYLEREVDKLLARKADYLIQALNDRVDTLFVIMDGCDTTREVLDRITNLFDDTNPNDSSTTITLSTIHRCKGREWQRVFILGFNEYMPSKWARQPWEMQQERNLCYVAVTRTKDQLILVG